MNQKQIINLLKQTGVDSYERERLQQLLHYMQVEGVEHATPGTRTNGTRTQSKTTARTHTHTKSNTRTRTHKRRH